MTLRADLIACQCQIPDLADIYERYFPDNVGRRFVEVGAFDGYQWSNTYALTRLGWSGLLFEPMPEFYRMAVERYADNPLIKIEPCAIVEQCGMVKLFAGGSMTTIQEDMIDVWARVPGLPAIQRDNPIECESHTLDCALARHSVAPDFDLLVIDAEGADDRVLKGFSLDYYRPHMVIVELDVTSAEPVIRERVDWITAYMTGHGYGNIYQDAINTIFVRRYDA